MITLIIVDCQNDFITGTMSVKNAKVAVFGIGGVGSYAVEMLARSGIGNIDIIDGDIVNITNKILRSK